MLFSVQTSGGICLFSLKAISNVFSFFFLFVCFFFFFSPLFLSHGRSRSLDGFVVELEEIQNLQHGLSDVATKTMGVLRQREREKSFRNMTHMLFHKSHQV